MGNILAFFSTYYRFFLFLILELLSVFLVIRYNKEQNSAFLNWAYDATGSANKVYNDVNVYFHLRRVNDSLLAENARLRQHMDNAKYTDTAIAVHVRDSLFHQKYTFTPATVINNSVNLSNNYLTLAAGSNKGITSHAGVISTAGVIGITRYISPRFSTVLSVLHNDFSVSAMLNETEEIGSVIWEGGNPTYVTLKDIPQHVSVQKGMHVVTSPYSDVFPHGIPIGIVTDYEVKPGDATYTIQVKLSANIRNVQEVYVVTNLMREEQKKIESLNVEK